MSVLNRIASALNRNDEVPNQELAKELVESGDSVGIAELVAALDNPSKAIRNDCIKVLYEIGYLQPELITPHAEAFIQHLHSRDNRMVWGAMTALGMIAPLQAIIIGQHLDEVQRVTEKGSVITQDWGIRVLAAVSAHAPEHEGRIFPFLLNFLQECRPKDVPGHAESCMVAVNSANRAQMVAVLEARLPALTPPQTKRVQKVIRQINHD
ncbi:MAG: hypothetical protein H6673_14585 [Anaerolineales bacterium]|nr:hypothetical protein [Anaerolineales bacterium]